MAQRNVSEFGVALFQFMFSSVGMMVGNKMAMTCKLPSTLVVIQILGTIMLIVAFWGHVDEDKLTLEVVKA
eukprot:gene38321-43699_t